MGFPVFEGLSVVLVDRVCCVLTSCVSVLEWMEEDRPWVGGVLETVRV